MEKSSKAFAGAIQIADPVESVSQTREDWRLARAAHLDWQAMGMPRVNLLLIGTDAVIRQVLETLLLELREPIAHWCPGEPLVLPMVTRTGTMILHDVGALRLDEQRRLLTWLERAAGRTQIVSTTTALLLPRVQAGAFVDTLYYRLNTVCLDVTA